jgi:hypothetical protein
MSAVVEFVPTLGIVAACVAMGTARASYYRALVPKAVSCPLFLPRQLAQEGLNGI